MHLHTAEPYWLMKNGLYTAYPPLTADICTDVAIMGAGITGALTAYTLAKAGLDVVVVDKRHPATGSTAASTALLQYEIDTPLHELIPRLGQKRAQDSYLACYEAIDTVAAIIATEGIEAEFQRVPSLQYASYKKDVKSLQKEYEARCQLGMDVSFLDQKAVETTFGFSPPAALLSTQAAQVDAYALAHSLLDLPLDNLRVYDRAKVEGMEEQKKKVVIHLHHGTTITARKVVIACGYESLSYIPSSLATIGTTYAFISKPLPPEMLWEQRALLWETKDPYLYLRTTADNRILTGGRDDETHGPSHSIKVLPRKIQGLQKDIQKLFPALPLHVDFMWAGAFASTKDSLGYMGSLPSRSHTYVNLGFGGNGILYSQIGGEIIRDAILGRKHPYAATFALDR